MSELITVSLSQDEAIVLFEFFARFMESDDFTLHHTAEYLAFSAIAGQLDEVLTEPFHSEYQELLEAAQKRLSEGYEGIPPGVMPH